MKKTIITALLASTITAGVLTSLTFTGSKSLKDTQSLANTFKNTAMEYIVKAQELEELAQNQNSDITLLVDKIEELKEIKLELTTQIEELTEQLEEATGDNSILELEVERLKSELEKANSEITKANNEVEAHKNAMTALLDNSIFTTLEVPERIDISEALEDQSSVEVEYRLQNTSPNRAGAEEYYNKTVKGLLNTFNFTEEQRATISLIKVVISDTIENNSKFTATIEINCTDRDNIYNEIDNKIATFNATYQSSTGVRALIKQA